jgi:hypothetical protein
MSFMQNTKQCGEVSQIKEIEGSIINILRSINLHFDYSISEDRLLLISRDWVEALIGFSDDVVKKAYKTAVQGCKKKPTLSEFLGFCRDAQKLITYQSHPKARAFGPAELGWMEEREILVRQYGANNKMVLSVDKARAEYLAAQANGTIEEYKAKLLSDAKAIAKSVKTKY